MTRILIVAAASPFRSRLVYTVVNPRSVIREFEFVVFLIPSILKRTFLQVFFRYCYRVGWNKIREGTGITVILVLVAFQRFDNGLTSLEPLFGDLSFARWIKQRVKEHAAV